MLKNRKKINVIKRAFAVLLVIVLALSPMVVLAKSYSDSPMKEYRYTHQDQFDGMNIVHGVDLSYHNGDVDFKALKSAGISFIFLRVGYRGYGYKGNILNDTRFEEYYEKAKNEGFMIGVYFYSQALNEKEAVEEADRALSVLNGRALDLPVVFDYEFAGVKDGRLDSAWSSGKLNKAKMTDNAVAFCERVKSNGYRPMIYASKYFFYDNLNRQVLEDNGYGIWLAHYSTGTDYKGKFNVWQYSSTGKVAGVKGNVDCNFMYVSQYNNIIDIAKPKPSVVSTNTSSATLKWEAVDGADGYDVCKKVNDNFVSIAQTDKATIKVNDLSPATNHYLYVVGFRYVDGIKYYGAFSKSVKATTLPAKVTGLSESSKTDTTVTVKWKKAGYPTGYNFYIYNSAKNKYELYQTLTTNSITLENLVPNRSYAFRVTALKNEIEGTRSEKIVVRMRPRTPVVKSVTSPRTKRLKITWDKNTKNAGYEVQWSTTKDFSSNIKSERFKSSTATSRTVTTYRTKEYYSIRVRSYVLRDGKKVYSPWSKATRIKVK